MNSDRSLLAYAPALALGRARQEALLRSVEHRRFRLGTRVRSSVEQRAEPPHVDVSIWLSLIAGERAGV